MRPIYAILSTSLALIFLLVTVICKNWDSCEKYIIQKLENTYKAKVHIGGEVKVSLITPRLDVHGIYIQCDSNKKEQKLSGLISIDRIEVRPSLISLFFVPLQPKSITLFGMKSSKENFIKIMNERSSNVNLTIKDSQIILRNNNVINIKEISIKSRGELFGKIKIGDNSYDFLGRINISKKSIRINFESNFMKLLFTGKKNKEGLQGKLLLTVNNSSNFINDLAKIFNLSFLTYTIPNENIEILSSIFISKDEFTATDLRINSRSIQARSTVRNDRRNNHTNINFTLSKIDFDLIRNNSQKVIEIKDLLECFRYVVPKNLSIDLNIEASDIQYRNKIFDKFYAVLKLADSEVEVDTLLQSTEKNNVFSLSGKVSNSGALSEFNGNFLVKVNRSFISYFFPQLRIKESEKDQFTVSSKLHFSSRILFISDINFINDKEFFHGSLKVSYTKKRNVINGRFTIHNFNVDKYNYLLFSNLSEIKWFKNSKYYVNLETEVSDLKLNEKKIEYLRFLLKVENGILVIDDIKISGEHFDATGNIKILVDRKYIKPLLYVNITGNKFNSSIFKLPKFLEIEKGFKKNIDQVRWSKKQIYFLDKKKGFDVSVQIDFAELKSEQNTLKNFHLKAVMTNNIITVKKVDYTLENGQVSFQGYLKSNSIYIKFYIVNLNVRSVGKIIGIHNLNGQINLNGSIKAQGKSFYDWTNNCSGEISLQTQGIEFTNVDLDSFITGLLRSKNKSEIYKISNIGIYSGSTFFKKISGKTIIKNGICSTSLQFIINQASGSTSSNLSLSNFNLVSLSRFFFIPQGYSSPIYIDIHLNGPIWCPKVDFDKNQIFTTLNSIG